MKYDASIEERTARVECDKSPPDHRSLALSEDIGEIVQRAGQLPGMMSLKVQYFNEFESDARYSQNDTMDIDSPKGSALTSRMPQLYTGSLEKAEDGERVLLNHTKGTRHDDLNIIDRLFSGVI